MRTANQLLTDSTTTPNTTDWDTKYVLLEGSAFISCNQGKIEITFDDAAINPAKKPIVFSRQKVMALSIKMIAEFTPENFDSYQGEPNRFRLADHVIPKDKDDESVMNPTDPPNETARPSAK